MISVAELKTSVGYRFTERTVSDQEFLDCLFSAVRFYNRWNPLVVSVEMQTQANVAEYTVDDDDFVGIIEVTWKPQSFETSGTSLTAGASGTQGAVPSLLIGKAIADSVRADLSVGASAIRGQSFVLYPTPESDGLTIYVVYAKRHVPDDADNPTKYETIPTEDFDILRDLIVAELLDSYANNPSKGIDYSEGLMSIRGRGTVENAAERASKLRQRVITKYSGLLPVLM